MLRARSRTVARTAHALWPGGSCSSTRLAPTAAAESPAGGTAVPKGKAGQPDEGKPRRADVAGEWRSDHGLAGLFVGLALKDDGTFTLDRREVAPKLELVTTGTWTLDGDRVTLWENRQVRDGQPVVWGDGVFFSRARTDTLTAAWKGGGWILTHGKALEFVRPRAVAPKGERTRP